MVVDSDWAVSPPHDAIRVARAKMETAVSTRRVSSYRMVSEPSNPTLGVVHQIPTTLGDEEDQTDAV